MFIIVIMIVFVVVIIIPVGSQKATGQTCSLSLKKSLPHENVKNKWINNKKENRYKFHDLTDE